ncbi:2-amino-4-hydroxy-6-hydroxymethyldihydropteridine diphosphokinase [Virgibacillus sp. MSJ-26]|uniref:2-amino-4-hydroxy-6- hydroxymethyldihydropteridine diphosphokinase n=1 Tax=Virgibacillus sp. MSJ-26 TaxID=2841522 RepID=UPI001C12151B|nr:2-amino-4-hydroxy-6-hydroxymethyldihydropteridine diphosphokinase [Virgibacillus sp. MSJ-26]MBU5468681.1 2-amino-4-hydroxy-6-hydroxymethyldihydropteridine diphosphokinase [Virgibacillus sp. MSJ-26]
MNKAFIALGTNIEPRLPHLKKAIEALKTHEAIDFKMSSPIYETAPVGYLEQADFLNMVVEVDTSLPPIELLNVCQSVENDLGRERSIRFGPRTIDLDILAYNDENIKMERLTVPHPRMHERAFVLVPFADIAANFYIPGINRRVSTLVDDLPKSELKGVNKWTPNESADE